MGEWSGDKLSNGLFRRLYPFYISQRFLSGRGSTFLMFLRPVILHVAQYTVYQNRRSLKNCFVVASPRLLKKRGRLREIAFFGFFVVIYVEFKHWICVFLT